MRGLSSIGLFLLLAVQLSAQSPHGDDLRMDCAACHTSVSWEIPMDHWDHSEVHEPRVSDATGMVISTDTLGFSHQRTDFALTGQHMLVDCRSCHSSLVFSEANSECISCHTDMHRNTVGSDCARCHTTEHWLVDFIPELHDQNGFQLVGSHAAASCTDCHTAASELEFPRIGNDCVNCHLSDFQATTNPNHEEAGFPTDCIQCHRPDGQDWEGEDIDHSFFPLTLGHDIQDCATCHTGGDFVDTPTDCVSCHESDFTQTQDPDHQGAGFTTDCASCHTTNPGWMPADFADHDVLFPIYSGSHEGEWAQCTDCHTDPSNYSLFDCLNCHTNPETDEDHEDVGGYIYENTACLTCHPTGDSDDAFDHNATNFPLTGAHLIVDCILCHADGYEGTPTDCESCHNTDFQESTNPDHGALGLPMDCASCHTTDPDWMPASFDIHDQFYVLIGEHAAIANNCAACHNGDYNNTPNDCFGCHQDDYNLASNPDHASAQFPTNCEECHSQSSWIPADFNHDNIYVLDGAHATIADDCVACHNGDYTNTPNTCEGCHTPDFDQSVNPNHGAIGIPTDCAMCHTTVPDWMPASFPIHDDYYVLMGEHAAIANNCAACHNGDYNNTPNDCFGCHQDDYNLASNPDHASAQFPTDCQDCHNQSAWIPANFNHDNIYVLDGAHATIADDCVACHNGDYSNTPNTCEGCHTPDFDQSINPNHGAIGIPTDCTMCHTTVPDWMPASFPIHDDYYVLMGAHAFIANDCAACHNGDYNNTPNDCFGCHSDDYNNTVGPDHVAAQFSTDCINCHTENEWIPATFDHDAQYFPIYSGAHDGEWSDCIDCHTSPGNYAIVTCTNCHINPETDDQHDMVGGYIYESTACLACHPMGDADNVFDHNMTAFPLTGAHLVIDCLECHADGFEGTPTDCAFCHTQDYNNTTNPDHQGLGLAMDCATCHTTEPGWSPADFPIHNDYYVLNGAHSMIANDCAACHNGDYNNTPNTCDGCHIEDYNATSDPDHQSAQFPITCEDCHTEDAWIPANFDHNNFYVLDGAHAAIADDCVACHNGDYSNTPNTCEGCHTPDYDQSTNPNHGAIGIPTDCAMCHTTEPDWMPAGFPIHDDYYVLNGAHAIIANDCAACHNGDYNNTPNDCFGCHADDYNNTVDPDHAAAQFSTDCIACHTESEWIPATFDHDAQYFPIYSGAHEGEWSECLDCHTSPGNYAIVTCTNCHINPETEDQHVDVVGYVYESTACLACHPMGDADNVFDHNMTAFPLTGAHIVTDCLDCHSDGYEGTPTDCAFCHTQDYNNTTNPDHQGLGLAMDCATCHTTEPGWSPADFPIHNDYYVLNGAHNMIANDCAACHNGDFNNTPNTCDGCHIDDYNATTNPDHQSAQFPVSCDDCHTEDAWIPANFNHDDFYVLDGAHATIADDCVACHNGDYSNTPNTCDGCHTPDYDQSTNPNHQALGIPMDCESCHTTEPGWSPADFPIHNDYYVLNGAHSIIANDCAACHNGDYNNTPNTCDGCHINDYNNTTNPDHETAQFPVSCDDCHTEDAWSPANFNHDDFYVLNGAHALIADDCVVCHNGDYANTPNTCDGCHLDDYNSTTNPDHQVAQFPISCDDCHTEDAWIPANFNHDDFYVLDGAHATIADDCAACHMGDYNNTPNTCDGCHTPDYNQSTNPNHQALGIPIECETCHTTAPGWSPADFPIHNDYYVLNGAHSIIANDCAACHNGDYNNTPNTCDGCHLDDYTNTTNPDHQTAQFPITCDDCHTEDAWMPANFNHDDFYVLNGAHALIADDCAACHMGDYNNTPNTCDGCHLDEYNSTTNPDHQTAQFPITCDDCHTEDAWIPANFNHNDFYVLDGAHALIADDCAACHMGDYNNTPNTCDGCHISDFNQTQNPNHVALGIPVDCDMCHTTDPGWIPADFPIHNDYYVLNGAHAAIANDCAACHNGDYNNTPNTCDGCHLDDYNMTTNPSHVVNQFPITCEDCHTENTWIPSTFDHNSFYVLDGAHLVIANDCVACHNGDYNNTPNTCDGCHLQDHAQSTNPNHTNLAIPVNCELCHTTDPDWMPASFPIHDNYYPLNGAHAVIQDDCAACHNGDYNNTPNTCYGCHQNDYNQANNPDHNNAGFPTTCESCHTENAWVPANWDHDGMYFPIFSGKHDGEWTECVECHTIPGNFTAFSCIDCHEHDDPVNMLDIHEDVSGYEYTSPACYACHPDGEN